MTEAGTIIGLRIKKLREEKKLTQAQVAKGIGVKRSTYAEWENGTEPKIVPILKIAAFLRVSLIEIVHGIVDGFSEPTNSEIQELRKEMAAIRDLVLGDVDKKPKKVKNLQK